MPLKFRLRVWFCVVCILIHGLACAGPMNMIGVQSHNEGMVAVPAPRGVVIDGNLADWDTSGRIRSFNNIAQSERYAVETSAMWDAENLYLAFTWRDPSPLANDINPRFNPTEGWKGDAMQLRIKTDRPMWMTVWHYAPGQENTVLMDVWKDPKNARGGTHSTLLISEPGASEVGEGVEMAVRKTEDGYTQEMKLPWKLLYTHVPVITAGLSPKIGFEFLWGSPPGVPGNLELRYADNLQAGTTSREFFWTTQQAWGDVTLSAEGNVPLRQYRAQGAGDDGPHQLRFSLPKEARRFTVVIEDTAGRRVRNLLADRDPAEFMTAETGGMRAVVVGWNGRDDFGAPVAAGTYRSRGLWHGGLDAVYDITFDNPGTPPWETADGTGAWGSNHANPLHIARAGDGMILSWPFSEGGHAVIGLDASGKKIWGNLRGADPLAADGRFVYGVETHHMSGGNGDGARFFRLGRVDGANRPFVLEGKDRPFPLSITEILGVENSVSVTGMAVNGRDLAIALGGGDVVVLDADSAVPRRRITTGMAVTALAYSEKGELHALADGRVYRIDASAVERPLVGVTKAVALAFDLDGHLLVADRGPDQQVKAFSAEGKLVYVTGKKGGRALRGEFDPQTMTAMTSVAVNRDGGVWVVESITNPRRVSIWGRDGRLVRAYLGGAHYAGTGRYLHETDPTRAYAGPVEWRLDRATGESRVSTVIWKSDETRADEPKSFDISLRPNSYTSGRRFRSEASERAHEYLFKAPYYPRAEPLVILMEDEAGWRPVAAIGDAVHFSGSTQKNGSIVVDVPSGDFTGLDPRDGVFWNDLNEDGRVQRVECEIVPAIKDARGQTQSSLAIYSGWNAAVNMNDLSFYTTGINRYTPLRFTEKGAPVYGAASVQPVVTLGREVPFVLPADNLMIGLRTTRTNKDDVPAAFAGYDLKTGERRWHYPNNFPGVHGSHRAPIATAGTLVGPLKITGSAETDGEGGRVFAIRGNLGQDYFFTADGLLAGAIFQDMRLPPEDSLPATIEAARGKSLGRLSEGGEPFSGWFGRQSDGRIRLSTSLARTASLITEITGLETIKRFAGPMIVIDAGAVASEAVAVVEAAPNVYRITRTPTPLPLEQGNDRWNALPAMAIQAAGSPERGEARLAYDDGHLYARFCIVDATPLMNGGRDFRRLFKTGDAVDLQFGPKEPVARKTPVAGDQRVVLAMTDGEPKAVLMRPVDKGAPKGMAHRYESPVWSKAFDRVELMDGVRVHAVSTKDGYTMTAAIPWARLGVVPAAGLELRGDAGFISSDAAGTGNVARAYWANRETGLVNDEPAEAWLTPANWGVLLLK